MSIFSVQEAGGCPLRKPRAENFSNQVALFTAHVLAHCVRSRFVVEAICFVKEASASPVEAAHSTCYCRVFLVQAGPFLAELRVSSGCQSFQRVCALSIKHSSFDPSMSLKSFSDSAALPHSQILYV